jgi:DNA-binding NarL/FixJ family response regulator
MQPLHVVLFQGDSNVAQGLVSVLANNFNSVRQVQTLGELRSSIAKHRAVVAILDMEAASISDVQQLSREFPTACIVCTHRLADEHLWTAALNAGAADVCPPSDASGILRAALGNAALRNSAVA